MIGTYFFTVIDESPPKNSLSLGERARVRENHFHKLEIRVISRRSHLVGARCHVPLLFHDKRRGFYLAIKSYEPPFCIASPNAASSWLSSFSRG